MPAEKAARFRFSAFMDPLWRPTTFRPKIALAATTYLSTFTGTRATDIPSNAGLGYEIWAEVTEAGNAVDRVKVGDRVVLPFNLTGSHFLSGEKSSPDRQRRLTYNSMAISKHRGCRTVLAGIRLQFSKPSAGQRDLSH
jgi:hypothetical protein